MRSGYVRPALLKKSLTSECHPTFQVAVGAQRNSGAPKANTDIDLDPA